ncbi:MAG: hypothetical protein C0402_06990 [Thermodesulfovibrio sp.]|nr:hypothetical protein [Thermodesulfovibrio sp.]
MILKSYQTDALDWLEAFFRRCKLSKNPAVAYAETTEEWRGIALNYRSLRRQDIRCGRLKKAEAIRVAHLDSL